MRSKKLCYDFNLGDYVQIIKPNSKWKGKLGIIDCIRHGIWADRQTEYETEFLVKELGDSVYGRMILHPGDFKKIDNVYTTFLKIKKIATKSKYKDILDLLKDY